MRQHPILFGAPMVRATLEGRKMQTSCASLIALIDAPAPALVALNLTLALLGQDA